MCFSAREQGLAVKRLSKLGQSLKNPSLPRGSSTGESHDFKEERSLSVLLPP